MSHTTTTTPDIDLSSGEFWSRNPHDELTWLRHHAPVYFDGTIWGVASHALVKEVSLHPEQFCNRHGIRPDATAMPMMIDNDGAEHKRRRNLVNRGFTPRRLAEWEPRIEEICRSLIDAVCERGRCDAVADLAAWLPLHVIADMLGFPGPERPRLLEWSDDMLKTLVGRQPDVELLTRAGAAYQGFREFILGKIEERRADPGDDMLGLLIAGELAVDAEDVIHDALILLIGGDETTRHVISGGLYQLLRHRDQWERLRRQPQLIPTAVEEMLRWVSPIKNMARTAVTDTELGGQRIRAGEKLLLLYPSANRDETVFDDPFRFDVTRDPNPHLAFGIGTHFCLGNNLARLELRIFFRQLLERLPDLELADTQEPAYRPANFVSGYESMPVEFTPVPRLAPGQGSTV